MLQTLRRRLPTAGAILVVLLLVFFASADDPSTDIPIVCPDFVYAGQSILGYVTEYTPSVLVRGVQSGGTFMPGSPVSGFGSTTYFCFPTKPDVHGYLVFITAQDADGQSGTAVVLVL